MSTKNVCRGVPKAVKIKYFEAMLVKKERAYAPNWNGQA
jgi:hypothetical protein